MKPFRVLILPLFLLAGCGSHEEADPVTVVDVKVAKAVVEDVTVSVRAPASVFAREQASISARITAPIRKLLARKGDSVEAGQALVLLENRDLIAQRDEAAAAAADAEANLQRVASGTLPADIERARGQVVSAEAAFNQAQKFYERRRQLFEQGAIPQRDLVLSQTELAQAKAGYEVARKSLDLLQNQSRDKEILSAKSKLEQAQARFALVGTQLEFAEIRSPFSGAITEQFMYPGDMARPDAPILTLMDLSVAVARAQVPESEAARVRAGSPCAFRPAESGATAFGGRVSVVNQAVDPARRTVEIWCEIPNPKRALKAGAFGQVSIVTGVAPNSVVVPLAAVQFAEGTGKGVVMVAGQQGVAVKRDVEAGEVFDGKVQIKSGLTPGEQVIIEGAYGLPEGTRVRVLEDGKQ
jgi:HlyD family secretion protein